MMPRLILMLLAVLTMTSGLAVAQSAMPASHSRPAVLELFTSQGCSSCPAADELFKQYAERRDIIALSLPVDYWDYLGWKDTLASPKFSKRQRAYAKLRGDGKVYTPQIVVNGRSHVIGSAQRDIDAALATERGASDVGAIQAVMSDGTISIVLSPTAQSVADATVWLAVLQAEAQVPVRGGENRGRTLTYFNVVRDLLPLGMWSGAASTIKQQIATLPGTAGDRYAVIVQAGFGGPVIAAAWVVAAP